MTALYVHAFVLWTAFFGMIALPTGSMLWVRSRQLGALTFAIIVIEAAKFS